LKGHLTSAKIKLPHNFVQGTLPESLPEHSPIKAHAQTWFLQKPLGLRTLVLLWRT